MYSIFGKIQKLINEYNEAFTNWDILQNGLQEELSNDRVTLAVANENRDGFKYVTNQQLSDLASDARQTLTKFIEVQKEKAQELTTTSVTADDLAEINILEAMEEVSREELESYQAKYEDKPLLLKRLAEVARKHGKPLLLTDKQKQNVDPLATIKEFEADLGEIIRRHDHVASFPTAMTETDRMTRKLQTDVYQNKLAEYKAKAF